MEIPKNIVIIGTHGKVFVDSLKSSGHTVTDYATYLEYKESNVPMHAVIINGQDDVLADSVEIAGLLNSYIVLVIFSPSPTILTAIRDATENDTVVNLAEIEVADGTPLILHKVSDTSNAVNENKDDILHITPGFTVHISTHEGQNSEIASKEKIASLNVEQSIYLLEQALDRGTRDREDNSTGPGGLAPPPGTYYFRSVLHAPAVFDTSGTVPWTQQSSTWSTTLDSQRWKLDWTVTLYACVIGARPDVNFASNNGQVYVFAAHSGNIKRVFSSDPRCVTPNTNMYYFLDHVKFGLRDPNEILVLDTQADTTLVSSNNTSYSYQIQYSGNFDAVKKLGGNSQEYAPHYQDNFTLEQFSETSLPDEDPNGGYFTVDYKNYYDRYGGGLQDKSWMNVFGGYPPSYVYVKEFPKDYIPIHGLTVLTSDQLVKTSLDFDIEAEIIGFMSQSYSYFNIAKFAPCTFGPVTVNNLPLDLTFGYTPSSS